MKKFEEMTYEEQKEVTKLFANWLKDYTHVVINYVMEQADEILDNKLSMKLIKELYIRETKEVENFEQSIRSLFRDFEGYKKYDPHNNVLEHSNSYRDVLYDMYIRGHYDSE